MKTSTIFLFIIFFVSNHYNITAQSDISAKEIEEHIAILASDAFEGRKPGTKGDVSASNYILRDFAKNKLNLLYDNGFQEFELVTDVKLGKGNSMSFDDTVLVLEKDFIPFSFSGNTSLEAGVCFVGYGFDFDADSVKWNDYNNMDVKGKWVMMLRADPELDNFNSVFLPYTQERSKIIVAKDKGAKGVIFVSGKEFETEDVLTHLSFDKTANNAGIPVINITRKTANRILKKDIEQIEKQLNETRSPNSFYLKTKIKATTGIELLKEKTNNIVAIVEGVDDKLKNEYIVVGAHFDHLGWGGEGSGSRVPDTVAIHYGADDNASGVAAVLELAEKFSSLKNNKRSIIFVAFGAEEMGLVGSKHFVENPPFDTSQIVAMFNFDMVGRLKKGEDASVQLGGTGTSAEFDSIISIYDKNLPFKLTKSPEGYGPSDHASFYSANIPVLYATSGVHEDYHTPEDKTGKINFEGEKQIVDFVYQLINDIANSPSRLTYKKSGSKVASRSSRRLKVTFGIIPDVSASDVEGLRITGVRSGGPAESGGMKANDVIISVAGDPVSNIYDYMYRLAKLKPGQTVVVEVKRGEEVKVLLLQL